MNSTVNAYFSLPTYTNSSNVCGYSSVVLTPGSHSGVNEASMLADGSYRVYVTNINVDAVYTFTIDIISGPSTVTTGTYTLYVGCPNTGAVMPTVTWVDAP